MTPAARPRLLERLVGLSKRPLVRAALASLLAFAALMAYVRGAPVAPPQPERLRDLIARMSAGAPTIDAQAAIDDVGAVASALVAEEGVTPGPFRVLYLPRLDPLEKFHHAMHGPFTGIVRMYCDLWVHSVTTYGAVERTWGGGEVAVRPSLKLPILLFLMDRLGRGKSTLGEYLGAIPEAISGIDMHTPPGRARLWKRVLAACERHPELAPFVTAQLAAADPAWTDGAETRFWSALATSPTRARLDELTAGGEGAVAPVRDPAAWVRAWHALLR